jgi:hypothetical protein
VLGMIVTTVVRAEVGCVVNTGGSVDGATI